MIISLSLLCPLLPRRPQLYLPMIVWHPVFQDRGKRRLSNNSWSKQRMRVLVRDNFCCQAEGCRVGHLSQLTVHHIVPKSARGSDNLSNLVTFCRQHHEALYQGH